jgi:hypothetical protein
MCCSASSRACRRNRCSIPGARTALQFDFFPLACRGGKPRRSAMLSMKAEASSGAARMNISPVEDTLRLNNCSKAFKCPAAKISGNHSSFALRNSTIYTRGRLLGMPSKDRLNVSVVTVIHSKKGAKPVS